MGELHLEVLVQRMLREFKVQANVGKPQVAYREAITRNVTVEETYDRVVGGKRMYASLSLRIAPQERGAGCAFSHQLDEDSCPLTFVKAIEEGCLTATRSGVLAGYEMVDTSINLLSVGFLEEETTEVAFKMAASTAFKKAARKAGAVILEPIMRVEVVTPEEYMGAVVNDLNTRHSRIVAMESRPDAHVVRAEVALSEMFGYSTDLRSVSQGRASYSMEFSHYDEAPKSVQDKFVPQPLVTDQC
jgi:elongation factor G